MMLIYKRYGGTNGRLSFIPLVCSALSMYGSRHITDLKKTHHQGSSCVHRFFDPDYF